MEALVDRRMAAVPSDRLYSHVQPGRRELAITLLIDVSGSTGDVVVGEQRVIDIPASAIVIQNLPEPPKGMTVTHVDVVVRVRKGV